MFTLPEHSIAFEGLKEKTHQLDYQLEKEFFDLLELEQLQGGNLRADVQLTKRGTMLDSNISLSGSVITECDRCLQPVELVVEGSLRQVYRTGGLEPGDNEEVIVIPSSEHHINLTNPFYECLVLSLPQRRVHELSECDQKVVQALETERINETETDPRWAALKGLTG